MTTYRFYVLQLLHPKGDASQVSLFTRWGRVGENGASQTKGPFPASEAEKNFAKQFKSKTGADYAKRTTMVPKAGSCHRESFPKFYKHRVLGKYTWLEKAYDDEDEPEAAEEPTSSGQKPVSTVQAKIPESKHPLEIQDLVAFMFNQE